jgi:hypothetical protein
MNTRKNEVEELFWFSHFISIFHSLACDVPLDLFMFSLSLCYGALGGFLLDTVLKKKEKKVAHEGNVLWL